MTDDLQQIRNLSYAYTAAVDDGEWDQVAELLAEAVLRPVSGGMNGEPVRGREAVRRFYDEQVVTYDGNPRTKHLVTNHVIEIDADTAIGRSYFTVLQALPKEPPGIVVSGRYHDAFARDERGWRFTEKVIHAEWFGAIRNHFRIAADHSDGR